MALKLVSVNIERSLHLNLVVDFIEAQQPDVLCLQELCERDVPLFEELMGGKLAYAPMSRHPAEVELQIIGTAIVSRFPLRDIERHYYKGDDATIPTIGFHKVLTEGEELPQTVAKPGTLNCALLAATVEGLRISTTHLTVTPNGISTPEQLIDATNMLNYAKAEAEAHGGLFICGDFNAPRGNPTFSLINESFIDAIPAHYTTSIDTSIHRVGKKMPPNRMVDGLFHTPSYKAENVSLNDGVSDHMAIAATLSKA